MYLKIHKPDASPYKNKGDTPYNDGKPLRASTTTSNKKLIEGPQVMTVLE